MKDIILYVWITLLSMAAVAQQMQGKVIYQLNVENKNGVPGVVIADASGITPVAPPAIAGQQLPESRFELSFGNKKMTWKKLEDVVAPGNDAAGAMSISVPGGNSWQDNMLFIDLATGSKVQEQYLFDKQVLVVDSMEKLKWIISDQTKTILGHTCSKATARRMEKITRPVLRGEKFEQEEVEENSEMSAWFTRDIPVAAGPSEVAGQLPGLVLELEISRSTGKTFYKAVSVNPSVNLAGIKAPSKGAKLTPAQYRKELDGMMKHMQRRNKGRRNATSAAIPGN